MGEEGGFADRFDLELSLMGPGLIGEQEPVPGGRIEWEWKNSEQVDLNAPTTGLLSSVVIDLNEEPSVDLNADLMEAQGQLPAAARMDKSDGQEGLESESSAVCDVSEDTTYVGYESGNEQRESSLASSDFTNNEQLDGGNHTAAVQNRQGWKKRPRVGQIPDEKEETTMNPTALEKALKSYAIRKNGLVVQPTVGTHFDSMAEAFEFYNLYSWQIGFGIRYDRSRRNSQRTKTIQDIVCGCAGKPRKENSRSSCCGCPAMMRIARSNSGGWYVKEHVAEHNHQMSQSFAKKQLWRSHRHIDTHTKRLIKHLRDNNVNLSKVFSVISSFFGDYGNATFTKRSVHSLCAKIARDNATDDIGKTVALFLCIASISSNRWRAMLGITAQCRPRVLNQAIIRSIMLRCTMDLN